MRSFPTHLYTTSDNRRASRYYHDHNHLTNIDIDTDTDNADANDVARTFLVVHNPSVRCPIPRVARRRGDLSRRTGPARSIHAPRPPGPVKGVSPGGLAPSGGAVGGVVHR